MNMRITKEQQRALSRAWLRRGDIGSKPRPDTFLAFRRSIQPTFGMDGAIVVQWCGMWLCIEKDGYTHT
jgi:hypothetical protein